MHTDVKAYDNRGKCAYAVPHSPMLDPKYRERALSMEASKSPWRWPITATSKDTSSVIDPSQFARIVEWHDVIGGRGACRFTRGRLNGTLDKVAGPDGMVAIAYLGYRHHSLRYGHIW